jgi:thiaminase
VREDFVTYEWVDLHSGPYFTKVVNYLRDLLDQEGERMTSDNDELGRQLCQQRFLQAVQLEEDFFENAYRTTS